MIGATRQCGSRLCARPGLPWRKAGPAAAFQQRVTLYGPERSDGRRNGFSTTATRVPDAYGPMLIDALKGHGGNSFGDTGTARRESPDVPAYEFACEATRPGLRLTSECQTSRSRQAQRPKHPRQSPPHAAVCSLSPRPPAEPRRPHQSAAEVPYHSASGRARTTALR